MFAYIVSRLLYTHTEGGSSLAQEKKKHNFRSQLGRGRSGRKSEKGDDDGDGDEANVR